MPKMWPFSSSFNIKMATQMFTNLFFFNALWMTAVTIQSDRTVLNEVQDK